MLSLFAAVNALRNLRCILCCAGAGIAETGLHNKENDEPSVQLFDNLKFHPALLATGTHETEKRESGLH